MSVISRVFLLLILKKLLLLCLLGLSAEFYASFVCSWDRNFLAILHVVSLFPSVDIFTTCWCPFQVVVRVI